MEAGEYCILRIVDKFLIFLKFTIYKIYTIYKKKANKVQFVNLRVFNSSKLSSIIN